MSRRPEHELPAELYYNRDQAKQYGGNSRVHEIQRRMTQRAIELLALPKDEPCLLLDLGCGTGLCGEVLQHAGHTWIGTDISKNMLELAKEREFEMANEEDGSGAEDSDAEVGSDEDDDDDDDEVSDDEDDEDEEEEDEEDGGEAEVLHSWAPPESDVQGPPFVEVMQHDMGTRVPFRPGTFDGAVSISAIQWLCNIDKRGQVPQRRLKDLFQSLHHCLRRGARAVFQFYPENPQQTNLISTAALKCGFGGGVIVDYPHSTRAKKFYLVIYAGLAPQGYQPPQALEAFDGEFGEEEDDDEDYEGEDFEGDEDEDGNGKVRTYPRDKQRLQKLGLLRQAKRKGRRGEDARPVTGTKDWIKLKKADRRKKGHEVKDDSKYTARKRRRAF